MAVGEFGGEDGGGVGDGSALAGSSEGWLRGD